ELGEMPEIDLPDDSVDLVLCSPPYEARRSYGIGFNLRGEAWVEWAVKGYLECLRVCRGLVVWVVEGETKRFRWSATPALLMADLHRAGVKLRKPPAYKRVGIPGSGGPDWLRNDYEFCVCATKNGRLPWSDNTACGHPPKWAPGGACSNRLSDGARVNQWGRVGRGGGRDVDGTPKSGDRPSHVRVHTKRMPDGSMQPQSYMPPAIANPGNVIECHGGGGHMGSKLAHENEAPFPQSLAEFFVKSFCPPGGVVLDPFSGSGTTAAAAIANGRRAIAFDVRESQVDLTRRRVAEVLARKESAA